MQRGWSQALFRAHCLLSWPWTQTGTQEVLSKQQEADTSVLCRCSGSGWNGVSFPVTYSARSARTVARTALIPHQGFGYCWEGLAQHQDCLQNTQSQQAGQEVGRGYPQGSWPKLTKEMSHTMWCPMQQQKVEKERRGPCYEDVHPPKQLLLLPRPYFPGHGWTSIADGIFFSSVSVQPLLVFPLSSSFN